MDSKHYLTSVPRIRLRTLRTVRGSSSGDYTVKQVSSSGFEFDTLRGYEQGDDVRRIDWNSSVRAGSIMVRSFREQHNRTIIIAFDISLSTYAGSGALLKCHVMQILAHTVAYAAESSRDAIGLCLTNNDLVVEYIAPRTGKAHFMHCITTLDTAINQLSERGFEKTLQIQLPRNAWIILLTDGLVKNYESWWRKLAMQHTLTVVRVRDRYEKMVPTFCSIVCYDPEVTPSATRRRLAPTLQHDATTWYQQQHSYAKKCGIALIDIVAGEPYEHLIRLFFEQGITR